MTYEQTSTDGNIYLYKPDISCDYLEQDFTIEPPTPLDVDQDLCEKCVELLGKENR